VSLNKGTPQTNLLAVTGMAASPEGKLVQPSRGPLNLSWLFHVSAETARRGRERLARGRVDLDPETLAGWFCISKGHDQMALDHLEQRAWRKALKIWRGLPEDRWANHNRATLHRLMYLAEDSDNRGGHLRRATELYHSLAARDESYRFLADWSYQELEKGLREAYRSTDDETVAKSLLIIKEIRGMAACEALQEELMLGELDDLALLCATLVRGLLPYQGVVHIPPRSLLQSSQESAELEVLPPAVRLAFRLVPGSRHRRRVESMVAELCALLAQSMFKGGDGQAGRKWQGEARRWEPGVAEEWKEPEPEHLGDDKAVRIEFSELPKDVQREEPRSLGLSWLGIRAKPVLVVRHDPREEWLEAVRFMGFALFPLRRFAVYRHPDTGEVGDSHRLPLKPSHYLWQTVVVVVVSFLLVGAAMGGSPRLWHHLRAPATPGIGPEQRQAEISRAVERLKRLAEVEANLRSQPKPDIKRVAAIEQERAALIEKVQRLERGD
jgi:hypothetical protein